jgi:hypothetical protein
MHPTPVKAQKGGRENQQRQRAKLLLALTNQIKGEESILNLHKFIKAHGKPVILSQQLSPSN